MENITVRMVSSEADIIAFEKLLYQTFKKKAPDSWILDHYQLIGGCRLRSKTIPIVDQVFCVAERGNVVLAGMSGNRKCRGELQLEQIGFTVDRKGTPFVEGLTLFATDEMNADVLTVFDKLMSFIVENLKTIDVHCIYMTCLSPLVKMYELFGFERVSTIIADGKEKHLMAYRF